MAGDEIVALGAGISSTDGRTIETTVENRKMNPGADYRLTLDGEAVLAADGVLNAPSAHWAHFAGVDEHTNVGYWFPQPATVNLQREARTGSWYAISQPYNPKEPITRSYFTLWLDHGKSPKDATYAYVLLPGRDAAATAAFAAAPGVEILANTPQVQAARNTKEGVTGFSFWGGCRPGGRGERRCARVGDRARDARNDYRRRERSDAPEYGCGSCDALRGEGRKGGGGASRSEGGVALARRARSGYGRFSGPHPQRYAPEIGGCPLRYMGRRQSAAESDCRSCRA